jgi:predicted RNA-binding protein YlqC (UPF0109 family)
MTDTTTAPAPKATASQVRTWAQQNGKTIGARGRISQEIRDAYSAATGHAA